MNQQRLRSSKRDAFALVEFLVCLGMLAIAASVTARLFNIVMRTYQETPAATQILRNQAQWLGMLRNDAWSARDHQLGDGKQITFVTDDTPILWRQEPGLLTRDRGDEHQQWPLAQPVTWSIDQSLLTLHETTSTIPLATPLQQKAVP